MFVVRNSNTDLKVKAENYCIIITYMAQNLLLHRVHVFRASSPVW